MAFHILLCDSDIYSPNITIYDEDYDVFSGFKIITILFRVNGTGTISQQKLKKLLPRSTDCGTNLLNLSPSSLRFPGA